MKVEEMDINLAKNKYENNDDLTFLSVKEPPFSLYGIFYEENRKILQGLKDGEERYGAFARIPYDVAKNLNYTYDVMSSTTSGGRIKFSTNSNVIGVKVQWQYLVSMAMTTTIANSGFTLLEETDDGRKFIRSFRPDPSDPSSQFGFLETVDIRTNFNDKQTKMRNFILFCPLYNDYIYDIKVIVEKDSIVSEGKKYKDVKPFVYYGSSITHGAGASRPDNNFPALIESWTNIDYKNLGVSGSAKGELLMAEYCASIDSSIFICGYDQNAPTVKFLNDTHYAFYQRLRQLKPNMPIIFLTRPRFDQDNVNINEFYKVVHTTYLKAKKNGDKNVYFIDGRKYYPNKTIGENCHVDYSHPNDLGYYFIAKKIYKTICKILGL